MKKTRLAILAAALALNLLPAAAQQAKQTTEQICRQFTQASARAIDDARRARQDPEKFVDRVADNWLEGVLNHMLLAAGRSQTMTAAELASLGYAYCIARRPEGR